MNHFLDFGTHYFYGTIHENGLLSFEKKGFFGSKAPYDWHVQTFEPSIHAVKANEPHLVSIASRFASLEAHHAAISDRAGLVDFKWCPRNEAGSNCIGETVPEIGEQGSVVYPVQCFDIQEVIEDIVTEDPSARISIKCDIEGSEFVVLAKLFAMEGIGQWVKEVFVEWHDRFWLGKPNHAEIVEAKASIIKNAALQKVALYDWH